MIKIIVIYVIVMALSGCSTMSPQEAAAQDDTTCQGYGVKPGTDGYVLCRMQLTQDRHEDDEQRRANLVAVGQTMMEQR